MILLCELAFCIDINIDIDIEVVVLHDFELSTSWPAQHFQESLRRLKMTSRGPAFALVFVADIDRVHVS